MFACASQPGSGRPQIGSCGGFRTRHTTMFSGFRIIDSGQPQTFARRVFVSGHRNPPRQLRLKVFQVTTCTSRTHIYTTCTVPEHHFKNITPSYTSACYHHTLLRHPPGRGESLASPVPPSHNTCGPAAVTPVYSWWTHGRGPTSNVPE